MIKTVCTVQGITYSEGEMVVVVVVGGLGSEYAMRNPVPLNELTPRGLPCLQCVLGCVHCEGKRGKFIVVLPPNFCASNMIFQKVTPFIAGLNVQ